MSLQQYSKILFGKGQFKVSIHFSILQKFIKFLTKMENEQDLPWQIVWWVFQQRVLQERRGISPVEIEAVCTLSRNRCHQSGHRILTGLELVLHPATVLLKILKLPIYIKNNDCSSQRACFKAFYLLVVLYVIFVWLVFQKLISFSQFLFEFLSLILIWFHVILSHKSRPFSHFHLTTLLKFSQVQN